MTDELSKEERIKLKSFRLESKSEYQVYLREIITRMDKCIIKYKRHLNKLETYIKKCKNKDAEKAIVKYEDYSEFVDLISGVDSYLLNLIGDQQNESISYKKFRSIIEKRKNKGSLDFDIDDLDTETLELLKNINKLRNWANHVPESLLMSEIKLIREGKFLDQTLNPIEVYYPNYCTMAVIEDLLKSSKSFYEVSRFIHQRAKKDYSQIIGEKVRIERIYRDKPYDINFFEPSKLSAKVQTINMK
jgi:hypothetical protein